ncbi:MAG: prenyltransferase/squalene oxidase repeat-containing protein, partial [Planctomycetota bacterium]
ILGCWLGLDAADYASVIMSTLSSSEQSTSRYTRICAARDEVIRLLHQEREPGGWWVGELSASALSTATAISALSFYLETDQPDAKLRDRISAQIESGIQWIGARQNEDGGWGDTDLSYSNISTTMLVIATLHAAGVEQEYEEQLAAAQKYVDSKGGIEGIRARYGEDKTFAVPILANCAMAGIVPWKEVSALPFEAACVPQRFYNLLQLPVVSYAIPALVAIGIVKFKNDPPWDPFRKTIRSLAAGRSLKVLERMQPASGGFLEAVPLTSFVSMGLIKAGRADNPVVREGVRFIVESFREDGSWPIDTNLATWVTTLSINALASGGDHIDADPEKWKPCLRWLLDCQNTEKHPFTGADPGGWGWTDLSGAVPDADDTPGALIALRHLHDRVDFDDQTKQEIRTAAAAGVNWLIKLQNRDRGWPTFCRGWGRLPFDRSGVDISAHVLRALNVWPEYLTSLKASQSFKHGWMYVVGSQRDDGTWLPLWFGNQDQPDDINPFYGTAKVFSWYRDQEAFHTPGTEIGLEWLLKNQNSDGGWGGTFRNAAKLMSPEAGNRRNTSEDTSNDLEMVSSVEETGLVVESLLDFLASGVSDADFEVVGLFERVRLSAERGLQWLVSSVEAGTIDRPSPIGFYFAKLWYYERMYPLVFAAPALIKAAELQPVQSID